MVNVLISGANTPGSRRFARAPAPSSELFPEAWMLKPCALSFLPTNLVTRFSAANTPPISATWKLESPPHLRFAVVAIRTISSAAEFKISSAALLPEAANSFTTFANSAIA